jgi:hypothetical protein
MEKNSSLNPIQNVDRESEACLTQMVEQEQVLSNRVSGVKFVLVVLSASGMVFDMEALRQKVVLSYPDVAVFFQTTIGRSIGPAAPQQVDLLIDFTGPGQRQGWFYAKKLRRMARVAVGRNAGLFRKKIYDRIFDESSEPSVPSEMLQRERFVQKKVLGLAGVSFIQAGETPPDRGKSIALELPAMRRL